MKTASVKSLRTVILMVFYIIVVIQLVYILDILRDYWRVQYKCFLTFQRKL